MITVSSILWVWKTEGAGRWYFLTIPEDQSGELRGESLVRRGGFGSVPVEARIGNVSWRTSVFPQKSGGYILPVKKEVRRSVGIGAGDDVSVSIALA